jgi:hypothetical protein
MADAARPTAPSPEQGVDRDEAARRDAIAAIDADLPYLHKQRWLQQYGLLLHEWRSAEGEAKLAAREALREHSKDEFKWELSRGPLVASALNRIAARSRA